MDNDLKPMPMGLMLTLITLPTTIASMGIIFALMNTVPVLVITLAVILGQFVTNSVLSILLIDFYNRLEE